jgi:hypothetical protein
MVDVSNDVCDLHNASFLKYLTFIQDVITRMNRNAFQLKGWSITIVAALAALAVDKGSLLLFIVAAVATAPFCFLDAYYLLMERQLRGLYNDVINGCSDIKLFSMPINRYTPKEAKTVEEKAKYTYWRVVCSRSVIWFYGSMCLLCVAAFLGCLKCPLLSRKNQVWDAHCTRAASFDCSIPQYSELRDKDFEVRRRGEESFKWEYKWR